MAKTIMIQGTMSGVGKSLITAGLCRIFKQDGYRVTPFKSQNMALNSYVTGDGDEIGRAQAMQAEAAGISPNVYMNPILLKPNSDTGSQVIVMGKAIGDMSAREYYAGKRELIPCILDAFAKLDREYDIIVAEGAGSPAEINLRENDIVNMGLADLIDAPVLLVGDIDRGGVFAQLLGTVELLERDERVRVKGLIINKFRGDASLLDTGIEQLTDKVGIPVTGLIPYTDIRLEDEDSLSYRLNTLGSRDKPYEEADRPYIDIAVVRLAHMSNYTDMDMFGQFDDVRVRYTDRPEDIGEPDILILPGSKNTIDDLGRLYRNGVADRIIGYAESGGTVFGICGGMQMLGEYIYDSPDAYNGKSDGLKLRGLGLLPIYTVMEADKLLKQVSAVTGKLSGSLSPLSGLRLTGYEIHEGRSYHTDTAVPIEDLISADSKTGLNIYGTYIHGIFDEAGIATALIRALSEYKGKDIGSAGELCLNYREYKETQYDRLADILRESLDIPAIYDMLSEVHIKR